MSLFQSRKEGRRWRRWLYFWKTPALEPKKAAIVVNLDGFAADGSLDWHFPRFRLFFFACIFRGPDLQGVAEIWFVGQFGAKASLNLGLTS